MNTSFARANIPSNIIASACKTTTRRVVFGNASAVTSRRKSFIAVAAHRSARASPRWPPTNADSARASQPITALAGIGLVSSSRERCARTSSRRASESKPAASRGASTGRHECANAPLRPVSRSVNHAFAIASASRIFSRRATTRVSSASASRTTSSQPSSSQSTPSSSAATTTVGDSATRSSATSPHASTSLDASASVSLAHVLTSKSQSTDEERAAVRRAKSRSYSARCVLASNVARAASSANHARNASDNVSSSAAYDARAPSARTADSSPLDAIVVDRSV